MTSSWNLALSTSFNQPENNASLSIGKQMATDWLFHITIAHLTSFVHESLSAKETQFEELVVCENLNELKYLVI